MDTPARTKHRTLLQHSTKALNCPNCGATLSEHAVKADFTVCDFCGTTFRMSKTLTLEPGMGDLLFGADFESDTLPGWELIRDGDITFHKGKPSELLGFYKPRINSYYVLKSSGFLNDFDASITIKFTDGDEKLITAGFYPRFTNDGGYRVYISPVRTIATRWANCSWSWNPKGTRI